MEWIGRERRLYDQWGNSADLCLADILHCEVEPDSEAGVAGVRADEEVKLKLTDVVNPAEVPCRGNGNSSH